jgi:hypothetical protein
MSKNKGRRKKKTDVGSFSLQGWRERALGHQMKRHFHFPKYKDQSCALRKSVAPRRTQIHTSTVDLIGHAYRLQLRNGTLGASIQTS